MEIFPVDPHPQRSIRYSTQFMTIVSTTESGIEQRSRKWGQGRYSWQVVYETLLKDQIEKLWWFYQDRCGAYEEFLFPSFNDDSEIIDIKPVRTDFYCKPFKPVSKESGRKGNYLFFGTAPEGMTASIIDYSEVIVDEEKWYLITLDKNLHDEIKVGDKFDVAYRARFDSDVAEFEQFVKMVSTTGIKIIECL